MIVKLAHLPVKKSNFNLSSSQILCRTTFSPCEGTGHPQKGCKHFLVFMCLKESLSVNMNCENVALHSSFAMILELSLLFSGAKQSDVSMCMIALLPVHVNLSLHDFDK